MDKYKVKVELVGGSVLETKTVENYFQVLQRCDYLLFDQRTMSNGILQVVEEKFDEFWTNRLKAVPGKNSGQEDASFSEESRIILTQKMGKCSFFSCLKMSSAILC